MRALLSGPCEYQAELGGIARIIEVSFVSFKFLRYGGVLWDLCELNLAIFCMDQYGKCVVFCCVDKKVYNLD